MLSNARNRMYCLYWILASYRVSPWRGTEVYSTLVNTIATLVLREEHADVYSTLVNATATLVLREEQRYWSPSSKQPGCLPVSRVGPGRLCSNSCLFCFSFIHHFSTYFAFYSTYFAFQFNQFFVVSTSQTIIILLENNTHYNNSQWGQKIMFFANCIATWLRVEHNLSKQTPSCWEENDIVQELENT